MTTDKPICYTLAKFGADDVTYYAVSKSVIENSFAELKSLKDDRRKSIQNIVVDSSWKLPNFYFRV